MNPAARILGMAACLAPHPLPQEIVVHRSPEASAEIRAWRGSLSEGRPALRGFRAPVLERRGETAPIAVPDDEVARRCADVVARRLAPDGILATTAAAIEAFRTAGAEFDLDALCADDLRSLRGIGLPVDWLECFRAPDGDRVAAEAIVRSIATKLSAGSTADSLRAELATYSFVFRPSLDGFAVATESGEHAIDLVRLQISSGTYWTGIGDGGCLDMVRQLLQALPQARFVASVEEKHLEGLIETARSWSVLRPDRLTVIPETLPVAQWAQDNGKPGFAPVGSKAVREVVTLVPRYASRGEDGAAFVPGETFLVDGFASAGNRAVQSPLLFQGGDLLAARDPRSGGRILLLGEANLWRNTALGLSRSQVLEAFRIEFGVDRCVVLPAVSFHIDQEVTLRSVGDRLVAFVADPAAAARIVLRCGLGAIEKAGILEPSRVLQARADLDAGSDREFLEIVFPAIGERTLGFGHYPESLAASFSLGDADSGVGNLQRFLLALDLLVGWSMPVDELPLDPHSIAYLRSFRRLDEDRRALIAGLQELGIEIARVPSLPQGSRGIDYLNGVHEPGAYWMPAWGGLFDPLDRAAGEAFQHVLGPDTEVRPIFTSESQRRGGALHCSISVVSRP